MWWALFIIIPLCQGLEIVGILDWAISDTFLLFSWRLARVGDFDVHCHQFFFSLLQSVHLSMHYIFHGLLNFDNLEAMVQANFNSLSYAQHTNSVRSHGIIGWGSLYLGFYTIIVVMICTAPLNILLEGWWDCIGTMYPWSPKEQVIWGRYIYHIKMDEVQCRPNE